jgi:hypothetical protein
VNSTGDTRTGEFNRTTGDFKMQIMNRPGAGSEFNTIAGEFNRTTGDFKM